jgi:Zn-dependent protease with chaperone function
MINPIYPLDFCKDISSSTPEFLSTHPSNDTRIRNLTKWAPETKAEAKKFGVTSFN